MRILTCVFILFAFGVPVSAAPESLVIYLDGALVEKEAAARKGYLEFPLPDKILPDTLRIKPVGDCSVLRVQVENVETAKRHARELAVMMERKAHLTDRLKELEDREGIFRAAVKSHSSRALRKTKNNPEPLDTARKGTAFAVAQLESVHAARRKTERELASVEGKIASLEKNASGGKSARVWLSRQDGRIRYSCLVSGIAWIPWYDFRLSGQGSAETVMRAKLPPVARSAAVSVVPAMLADAYGTDPLTYPVAADLAAVASFRLPLDGEKLTKGPAPFLSFTIRNTSGKNLPPGEAVGYWQGEYLGRSHFKGCIAGGSQSLEIGRR